MECLLQRRLKGKTILAGEKDCGEKEPQMSATISSQQDQRCSPQPK